MANNALKQAMNGEKIPEARQKGALAEAVDKIKNMGGQLSKVKEVAENVGDAVLYTAETQGMVFTGSFLEGYFGEEKMDLGPVDMRTAGGVLLSGYGFYKLMSGKGGEHPLALGNGLLATGVGRMGRNAGKALAEQYASKGSAAPANTPANNPPPASNPPPVTPPALPKTDGDFGDLVRDIFLTPDAAGQPEAAGRNVPARHKPSRFIRADIA
jgi:hypothetical protein